MRLSLDIVSWGPSIVESKRDRLAISAFKPIMSCRSEILSQGCLRSSMEQEWGHAYPECSQEELFQHEGGVFAMP